MTSKSGAERICQERLAELAALRSQRAAQAQAACQDDDRGACSHPFAGDVWPTNPVEN